MLNKKYILLSLITIPLLLSAKNITLDTIEVNAQEEQNATTLNTTGFYSFHSSNCGMHIRPQNTKPTLCNS